MGIMQVRRDTTGRSASPMQLDALYSDVIVQRYEQFTGRKAERVTAGAAVGETL